MKDEEKEQTSGEATEKEEPEEPLKQQSSEPTQNDYTAGAIMANGIIWLWMESFSVFRGVFSNIPPTILSDLTYIVFIMAGYFSSQQVAKRSERNQLIASLRCALYSWLGSLFMMITMPGTPTISLALSILVCLLAGSVFGTYMLIRGRIIKRRKAL